MKRFGGGKRRQSIAVLTLLAALVLAGLFSGGAARAAGGVTANKQATITNTGGGVVRWREGAGTGYNAKGTLGEGDKVTVLEGPAKDGAGQSWYRVSVGSRVGWIDGRYLGTAAGSTPAKPAQSPAKPVQPAAQLAKQAPAAAKLSGYAKVANTGGDAIRLRSVPGGRVVGTASGGTVLKVVQGPSTDNSGKQWYQVASDGLSGWMSGDYLVSAPAPKLAVAPRPVIQAARAQPPKPAPQAAPAPKPAPAPAAPAPKPASLPALANSITGGVVALAMQYVGYNYRFGGTTPAGFDCSGFVYYIFNKAGIPMGRSMGSELASGNHISYDQLQPGDLVYFAGTYRSGISHISIYIGNGKIVHAADYGIGVTVSNLSDAYWAAHYAGAIRVLR
ncbi:MAG: NlpC/P60 family protein [Chloroflexia bacterium]